MLSAVLQPEIDTLQSQIAQLQAQIAQAEQRIANLTEVEAIANGAIESLQSAVEKVSALTPDALANLKSAVFDLFKSDSDSLDDSHQPIEAQPQPELNGQYSDFASLLSDAPVIDDPFVELVGVGNRVSYQRRHDGEIICTYAGFNNKTKAKGWGEILAVHHSVAQGFEVRESKRLTNFKYELKVWGMKLTQVERLAGCDLNSSPPSNYGQAPKRLLNQVPAARPKIEIGDIVASQLVPDWKYEVVEVKEDGKLDCRRLGIEPALSISQSSWSVTLISKAAPTPTTAEVEEELEAKVSIQPPDSTVSAVSGYSANPIGRRGADANWKAFLASGQKLDLKPNFDSMQKWRDIEAEQNALAAAAEPDF